MLADNFDDVQKENCALRSKMDLLSEEKNRCHTVSNIGGVRSAFKICKDRLNKYLLDECGYRKNVSSGYLLYCNEKGHTSCCLNNVSCELRSDSSITLMLYNVAKSYLTDSDTELKRMYDAGYGTCYDIGGKLIISLKSPQCFLCCPVITIYIWNTAYFIYCLWFGLW